MGTMTMLMFIMDHIYKNFNKNKEFAKFPDELLNIIEDSKKIEAKTIRDALSEMKDKLERIGKRIQRTSRHLNQIQASFHKSAGNVLNVLGKLRKNVSKFAKSQHEKKENEEMIKFIIIDPEYRGFNKIRKMKKHSF